MEIIDLSDICKVTEIKREKLFEGDIENLTVYNAWDSHGDIIKDFEPKKEYKNVHVKLERVKEQMNWKYQEPSIYDVDELFINGEKYDAIDIDSLKGNIKKATAIAIVGEG